MRKEDDEDQIRYLKEWTRQKKLRELEKQQRKQKRKEALRRLLTGRR